MTLTIASSDGISNIKREVFPKPSFEWKESSVKLLTIFLPSAGFDVLLGMAWIANARFSLNAKTKTLRLKENSTSTTS